MQRRLTAVESWLMTAAMHLRAVSQVSALVGGLSLFAMMTSGVVDVVSGQFLGRPVYLTYELVGAFMILTVWLSVAVVESRHQQISATFIYDKLPPQLRNVLDIVWCLGVLIFGVVVSVSATESFIHAFTQGERLMEAGALIMWPFRMGFVAGMIIFTVVALIKVARALVGILLHPSSRISLSTGR